MDNTYNQENLKEQLPEFTAKELYEFEEHPIWLWMKRTIRDRIELNRMDMELGIVETDDGIPLKLNYEGIVFRQGGCHDLRWIMNLIKIQIEIQEGKEERDEMKRKREEKRRNK